MLGLLIVVGGCSSSVDPNPVAAFTTATELRGDGTLVRYDASGCGDAQDGPDALEVRWDWDDDGIFDTPFTVEKTAERLYRDPGRYTLALEVRDSSGRCSTYRATVTVAPHLSLTPTPATLSIGERVTFTVAVLGVADHRVTWSATGGAVADGTYTAPTTAGAYQVTATSVADPAVAVSAPVTVVAGSLNVEVN